MAPQQRAAAFTRLMIDRDILRTTESRFLEGLTLSHRPDCIQDLNDEGELQVACQDSVHCTVDSSASEEIVRTGQTEEREGCKVAAIVKQDGLASEQDGHDSGSTFSSLLTGEQQHMQDVQSSSDGSRVDSSKDGQKHFVMRPRKLALSQDQVQSYASRVMALDAEGESYVQKINRLIGEAGGHLPSVTVEYEDVQIEADTFGGSSSIPSLTNTIWKCVKDILHLNGLDETPPRILKISGKLKPGRLTLLMGPPGSGKSLFMQMLGGRLQNSKHLRQMGEVRYNGHYRYEFNMARTLAMVDQLDDHVANLTVRETLEFARRCQNGYYRKDAFNPLEELRRARAANAGQRLMAERAKQMVTNKVQSENIQLTTVSGTTHGDGCKINEQMEQKGTHNTVVGSSDEEFEKLLEEIWGKGVRMEILLRTLDLLSAADTTVGNATTRGVSGGQRKRVTSAEMLVGQKNVLLMNEISTGLDSATTYSVVELLRNTTHSLHLTTLVSLLQPSPEVYNLFDDVILLANGLLTFHGPVQEAVPFFETLGFRCPERKDHASFLQEVTTSEGQWQYASSELRSAKGLTNKAYEDQYKDQLITTVEEISEAFWNTKWGRAMRAELMNNPFMKDDSHPVDLAKHPFALSWWEAVWVLMDRQWKLTLRDVSLVRGRLIQVIVMSLIVGSLFSGQGHNTSDARNFFGVAFLAVMFLSMGAMPELGITFEMKSVVLKQRDNGFYPPSAWSLALLMVRIPLQLVEAVFYSCIVYFWVGFYHGLGYYLTFYLICISSMIQMAAMYRLLAAASPNMDIASAIGSIMLLLLVVMSGYAIIRSAIPQWWIWAYWTSPFAYSLRAVVINEMTSPPWGAMGIAALESFGFQTDRKWIWIGIGYNVGMSFVMTYLMGVFLTFLNPPRAQLTTPADEVALRSKINRDAVERSRTQRRLKVASRRASQLRPMGSQTRSQAPSIRISSRQASRLELSGNHISSGEPHIVHHSADGVEELIHDNIASGLPFIPISLVYRKLQYFVPMPGKHHKDENGRKNHLELLKSISGSAVPGQLTALMGGSGAGKTTLMDIIAGRKTRGEIQGQILVNGFLKQQDSWARVVGYVEQNDVHSPQVLVKEALLLAARLRLPNSIPSSEVREFVEDVLNIVELTPLKNTLVGMLGVSGLSVEQRKRLTIAVELVANPSVMFMDEPTSGLDARAATIVMQTIRNVSKNGRTVMVTIHQPSIHIFESFDALVLLQRGGKLIYSGLVGEQSMALIKYLEAVPGVLPIKAGENPATWMLEVTRGASATENCWTAKVDFAEYYQASDLYKENEELIQHLIKEGQEKNAELKVQGAYATNRITQLIVLAQKFWLAYWRSPSYNLTRMLMTLLICLFYGTVFWGRGRMPSEDITIGNIQNVMGVLYSATNFQGMFNLLNMLPVVGYERNVFYRERAAKMYARASYITAVGIVELPYIAAQTIVFVPISYIMIGFKRSVGSFFYFFLLFFLDLCLFTYFGQFLVFLTPSLGFAQIVASAVQTIWSIFNGFLLPYPVMPTGWKWLNRLSPATWIIYGLAVDQLGENVDIMTAPDSSQQTVAHFMSSYFGYSYNFRWQCVLIVASYIIFFRLGSMLIVRFVNYQRR